MTDKRPLQCRYFLHGVCSKGASCIYSHDLKSKSDNVCKFYRSGSCSYGKECRYDHVRPGKVIWPAPVDTASDRSGRILPKLSPVIMKNKSSSIPENWALAPEFVPESEKKPLSYSEVACAGVEALCVPATCENESDENLEFGDTFEGATRELLCPFAAVRDCPFGSECLYVHGELCEMCNCFCLHPTDELQRNAHMKACVEKHESDMNYSFAVQKSEGVTCSICLDVVAQKSVMSERMFGLLENCKHPFCLSCIRNWRSSSYQDKTIVRSCPLCRSNSWFVTPSSLWIDDDEEKSKLVSKYKTYLSTRPCRNFDEGRGTCSFGTSCFYKHAYPDGTLAPNQPVLRFRADAEGDVSVLKPNRLWDFIEARDVT